MRAGIAFLARRIRGTSLRWRVGTSALALTLLAAIFLLPLAHYRAEYAGASGYLGVFVMTLIANATVIVPTPGFLAVVVAATVLNPLLVALLGAVGMTLGELTGYLIGRTGRALSSREFQTDAKSQHRWMAISRSLVDRWGMIGIVVLAAVPNPLFDIAGIAAGAARMGLVTFMMATFTGRLMRTLLLAYASAYSVGGLVDLFE